MSKVIVLCCAAVTTVAAHSADLTKDAQIQIDHLLIFISKSPCQFNRNGTWYSSAEAAEHIQKKYNYVLKKGLVKSPEDFIEYSATKSSMSGKKYKVRCGEEEIESADWLGRELTKYRQQKP